MTVNNSSGAKEWMAKNVSKYKTRETLEKAFRKKFKVSHRTFITYLPDKFKDLTRVKPGTGKKKKMTDLKKKSGLNKAMSLDDFVKDFDIPKQIEEGLELLGNGIIKDDDFRRELKVGPDKWRLAARMKKFEKFQMKLSNGSKVWGSPKSLAQARQIIDMTEIDDE